MADGRAQLIATGVVLESLRDACRANGVPAADATAVLMIALGRLVGGARNELEADALAEFETLLAAMEPLFKAGFDFEREAVREGLHKDALH